MLTMVGCDWDNLKMTNYYNDVDAGPLMKA